jgi:hypothetical protein
VYVTPEGRVVVLEMSGNAIVAMVTGDRAKGDSLCYSSRAEVFEFDTRLAFLILMEEDELLLNTMVALLPRRLF